MALDPISAVLDIGGKLIDRLWPDPTEAAKAKLELLKMQQDGALAEMIAQTDINKIEAGSTNLFIAGWRPFIGWGCGVAFLYSALFEPFARFIAVVIFGYHGTFPTIDTTLTLQILLGMLGMGALRSLDKKNGVAAQ
jgi:hypothetical protein